MSFLKKQTVGIWMTLLTLILAIVSFILYTVNIGGEGYFNNAAVPMASQFAIIAIIVAIIAIVLAEIPAKDGASQFLTILGDICRIAIPVLVIAAAMFLLSGRVQGFAFIYFSNADVLQEVQTPANISSAHGAIASLVALFVTAVVGMIGAFFSTKKKVK